MPWDRLTQVFFLSSAVQYKSEKTLFRRCCPNNIWQYFGFLIIFRFEPGLAKTRVFLKKPDPAGFFGFFWVFLGFFGFFWVFLGKFFFFNLDSILWPKWTFFHNRILFQVNQCTAKRFAIFHFWRKVFVFWRKLFVQSNFRIIQKIST